MPEEERHVEPGPLDAEGVDGSGEVAAPLVDPALRDGDQGTLRVLLTHQGVKADVGRDGQALPTVLFGAGEVAVGQIEAGEEGMAVAR